MATNWTLSEALKKITEGTDKAAIQDIGRRFPLTAVALAEIGQNAGAAKIIGAVPSHITARKIESVLKDGVEQSTDADFEDADDDEDETSKKAAKKPVKKAAKAKAEEDDQDEDNEEDDPVALYKKCKKAGIKVAPKKSAKYYKDQLAKAADAEEDTDDDDWDDEEEDEKPVPKKKPAKKAPVKKSAKKAEPENDEDEDEDEWDI